jgi:hypothetical protein
MYSYAGGVFRLHTGAVLQCWKQESELDATPVFMSGLPLTLLLPRVSSRD